MRKTFSQKQNKKYHSKTQLDEKKLAFLWCSLSSCFSVFLHCMSGGVSPCTNLTLLHYPPSPFPFRASAHIIWNCMKLRLVHNLKLLSYKVIKTCRRIQQRWSSWKLTRQGRMNLQLLKNLSFDIFKTITTPMYAIVRSWTDPSSLLPAYVLYGWPLVVKDFKTGQPMKD